MTLGCAGCDWGRHADTADLLELALAPADPVARAALEACPVCGPELARVEAFLGAMRSDCAAPEDQTFTARVLAATTREDLRRVVDLRLCAGFLREALRKQRLLRIAAACLVVHALALPIIAYMAFRDGGALRAPIAMHPEPSLEAQSVNESQALLASGGRAEGESAFRVPPRGSALEGNRDASFRERDGERIGLWQADNERRSTRLRLARAQHSSLRASPQENARHGSLLVRLLHACSERFKAGNLADFVRRGDQLEGASALETALWVELLLDHYALCGEVAPGLQLALRQLARARAQHPADAELCKLLLQRAAVLGFRIPAAEPWIRSLTVSAQADTGSQQGRELAMVWSQALRPLAAEPHAHPSLAAWSAWWGAEAMGAMGTAPQNRGQ